jgi:1-acyl-sn-glycerol-3-phosphate acyltransferase
MRLDLYSRLFRWVSTHRLLVLGATLVVTLAGILLSLRIDLEEDVLAILPQRDPIVDDYHYALRKFRQIDRVYFDVGVETDNPELLAQAADALDAGLETNASFAKITYRFETQGQDKVVDYLTGALPNLFTEADALALDKKLDPTNVREFLTVMRRKLAGVEGIVLKDVVAADPVGMSGLVLDKALPLQAGFGNASIEDGRLVSSDGRHVLLMAEPRFPSSNSGASAALVAKMLRLARDVEQRFSGVRIAITGGHRMTVDNATLIKTDATRCIGLGMGAMLVLCLTAFRRRWLAVVAFLPSFFGTLVAGVVLSIWQHHLSAIATGFAVIAIGITVDYAIHVIYHLDDAAGFNLEEMGRHVGRLVMPISIGALTTVAAFVVMASSPMHGYQQLGIFGAIGVLFSAAFALVIVPLLVPIPKKSGQPPLWLTRLLEKYFVWRSHRQGWLLAVVVVLSVVTALGVKRLRFDGDIARLNGITESTRQDEALIRRTWGDALGMTLVVARGATVDEALARNDRVAELLARDPAVTAVYSLASVCPSVATQEANIRRWHDFWTSARREALRQTLQQVGAELGFRTNAFSTFWKRIDSKPSLLSLEMFHGTPLEEALHERVALADGDNAVSTLLKLEDRVQVGRLRTALPGMIVLDQKTFASHVAGLARRGLGQFALWTGSLVAATLYVSLGSIEMVLATMLPLGFGLLWTFGMMGWLGLPIDMMNSVFVIFILGIGEDYGVFLVTSRLDEWHGRPTRLAATSASVLISALTTLFGFAVLVFAQHPVLFSMGTTVLLGMGGAFGATLILTPLCMDLLLYRDPPRGGPRWWHLLGTLWGALHLLASQVLVLGLARSLLKLFCPRTAEDRTRRAARWAVRLLVEAFPFGKLEYQDFTSETLSKPAILISNHQSAVDVLILFSLPGDVRMTVKKRVWDTPILGIASKLLGHVMVEPNRPETTLERCRAKLAEGASVHFFPEGTRSYDGFPGRFHRGAFELAVQLRQDILPVVLCDTWTCMPRDAYWFEPYHATVRALPRITPENFDYSRGSRALMQHCEAIVRAALQQQLDALNTPRTVRRKVERLYRYQGKFIEQFVHWKMKQDPVFASLNEVVPRRGYILDLGCGYGLATHWLAYATEGRVLYGVDYDEDKIRVAQRTAPGHPRVTFELRDILDWDYPPCDAILLLDVLHYWTPEKQQRILDKARRALRPGGRLVLRDGARSDSDAHARVHRWETFATRLGHNKTVEGLHFRSLEELETALSQAGFAGWDVRREAGRDSNLQLIAWVKASQCFVE